MARQYKKILKKIQPKKSKVDKPEEKPSKDYLLVAVLALTIVFMVIGWSNFTNINRGLYLALTVSLSSTYIRRHYKLNPTYDMWVERAGYVGMALAIVLFIAVIVTQYIM